MEERRGDDQAEESIKAIKNAAKQASIHVFTSFHLSSVPNPHSSYSIAGMLHGFRSMLIDVMQRISSVWPESSHVLTEDNVLRVGVAARV